MGVLSMKGRCMGQMNKILKKSLLSGLFFYSQLTLAQTLAQKISSDMSIDDLKEQMTALPRFVAEKGMEMSIAKMPSGYDCPLFSNSPYNDVLAAMQGLSEAIKTLPECDDKSYASVRDQLTQQIQSLSEGIETVRSNKNVSNQSLLIEKVKSIASTTQLLQTNLVAVAAKMSSPENKCYKSSSQSADKSIVFRANNLFQTIAPLALDFASKNPLMRNAIESNLPWIAGARAVSSGLSILETALSEIKQYNMNSSDTRQAIVENTCSFMKLYNRVEMINENRIKTIDKLRVDLEGRLNKAKKLKENTMQASNFTTNAPGLLIYLNLFKENLVKFSSTLVTSQAIILKEVNATDVGSSSESRPSQINNNQSVTNRAIFEASCGAVDSLYKSEIPSKLLNDMDTLLTMYKIDDKSAIVPSNDLSLPISQFKLLRDSFKNKQSLISSFIPNQIVKSKDDKLFACFQKGKEWALSMSSANDAFAKLIQQLEQMELKKSGLSEGAVTKINNQDQKVNNLQENKTKFDLFSKLTDNLTENIANSEFVFRFNSLPKYLFNGPQSYGMKSGNGPVYEILGYIEGEFKIAQKDLTTNVLKLRAIADSKTDFVYGVIEPGLIVKSIDMNSPLDNVIKLDSINLSNIRKDSIEHFNTCGYLKNVKKYYMEMVTHAMSLVSMCKMIEPVLHLKDVSESLKKYCISNDDRKLSTPLQRVQQLSVPNGPKDMFASVLKKMVELECPDSAEILNSK